MKPLADNFVCTVNLVDFTTAGKTSESEKLQSTTVVAPASEVFPVTAIVSCPALLNLTPTLYTVKPFSSVDAKM